MWCAQYESRFVDWMKEHNVEIKDGEDFVRRLDVWAENDDHIETHNSGNATYTLGHNKFSHLTSEEFQVRGSGLPSPKRAIAVQLNTHSLSYDTHRSTWAWVACV